MELWKDIDGFDGLYQISNLGQVRRIYKTIPPKTLTPWITNNGYLQIDLGTRGRKSIHRLVADAFCERDLSATCVNHINGVKTDNRADNLEWVDSSKNSKHSFYQLNNKTRDNKPVLCVETGEIFISISEASRRKQLNSGNISSCCRGKHKVKSVGGYHWRFYVQE